MIHLFRLTNNCRKMKNKIPSLANNYPYPDNNPMRRIVSSGLNKQPLPPLPYENAEIGEKPVSVIKSSGGFLIYAGQQIMRGSRGGAGC